MAKSSPVVPIRPRRGTPVLVCRKCLKRISDGGELKRALKSELKKRSTAHGGKRPRVLMTSCMDICPKRAVVVASAETLQRGEYLLLSDQAAVAEAVTSLIPPSDNEDQSR